MVPALKAPTTFDEFIAWLPENSGTRYELRRGVVIEMTRPRGQHSVVAGLLAGSLGVEIRQARFHHSVPKECIVRSLDGESGFEPDVIVLDRDTIMNEPRWEAELILTQEALIKLIIEVVSTNWRDDYYTKFAAYEELGIAEYWIVDYATLGGRRLGNPKQATLSVCELIESEYQVTQFRGTDAIVSPTFPDLELTVEQVFSARR